MFCSMGARFVIATEQKNINTKYLHNVLEDLKINQTSNKRNFLTYREHKDSSLRSVSAFKNVSQSWTGMTQMQLVAIACDMPTRWMR